MGKHEQAITNVRGVRVRVENGEHGLFKDFDVNTHDTVASPGRYYLHVHALLQQLTKVAPTHLVTHSYRHFAMFGLDTVGGWIGRVKGALVDDDFRTRRPAKYVAKI